MNSLPADVRVREVVKRYGSTLAVDRVSFDVERGHVLSLLGPSGCGKTTVLRMIAGLIAPDSGDITIKDRLVTRVPVHKRNIGMLFQNYALFPHLTVAENVAFGLEMRGLDRDGIKGKVARALDLVRLSALGERMPHQLSGGQQQRVALARALVIEPAVLLLDEPFGALDKKLREGMQIELRALQQRLAITTIMVTHDQEEALTLSDRIAVMQDGTIEQLDSPNEIYERPVSRFVASFIGASNFFTGQVTGEAGGEIRVTAGSGIALVLPKPATVGGTVTVALRPEGVRVTPRAGRDPGPNQAAATVDQIVYRGLTTHYYLRLSDGSPLMAFRQNSEGAGEPESLVPGDPVLAAWSTERNLVVRD